MINSLNSKWISRSVFTGLGIFYLVSSSISQEGFSKNLHFDSDGSIGYCVSDFGEYIIATGTHENDTEEYKGIYFSKIDKEGEVLFYDHIYDPKDPVYNQNLINELIVVDSFAYTLAHSFYFEDAFLRFNLNTNQIEILEKFDFKVNGQTLRHRSFIEYNGEFIFLANILDSFGFSENILLQIGLGENRRTKIIDIPLTNETASEIIVSKDSTLIIASKDFIDDSFNSKIGILEVDTLGNIIWKYHDEEVVGGFCRGVIQEPNGDIVFTYLQRDTIDLTASRPVIQKINRNKELIWRVSLGNQEFRRSAKSIWERLIPSIENDGYIFAGYQEIGNEEQDTTKIIAIIGKIDLNGDSLWFKRFKIIENEEVWRYNFHDLERTLDGGYIATGRIAYYEVSNKRPLNETILVKVNDKGEIINGTDSIKEISGYMEVAKVFPNPISDLLYVEKLNNVPLKFSLFDFLGNKLKVFEGVNEKDVFIIPMTELISGLYILKAIDPKGNSYQWNVFKG